jgi:lipopolysaccharide biosynthesis regulator YciM
MATQIRRVRRKRRAQPRAPISAGRTAIFAAAVLVGFALGFLVLNYAPRAYRGWRESRLLKTATEMLHNQDFDGATTAARQMLEIHPDSLAAYQILADATEKQNRADTVAWRAQIARLLPKNIAAQLNLASAALRFGQLDAARRALENVAPSDRDQAAFHVVAGWLARAQGNDKDVETHFAAALAQEPNNELYQFNLAVLRIRSLKQEEYDEARETLERLRKVPGFRTGAVRALLGDAIQRDDLERADSLAQDLQMSHQVTFADYLLCLDFYRKLDQKKFNAVLEKIKPVAAREPRDLGALMDWMNNNGMSADVLKWSDKLPPEITTIAPPAISIAEAFAEVKNWSRLKRWTRSGAWGESEYLRLAYQAHAARQSKQAGAEAEFDSLWRSADRLAAEKPERELTLARLASRWNLPVEAELLWQRLAKHPPMRREALDSLYRIHRASNNLRRLLPIAKQLHESSPREPGLAANYARLALIVEPNTDEAQRKAKEAYEAAPTDVNCAVTYAFALYGLGRTAPALEILRTLPPERLLEPHSAAFVAVIYLDENQVEAAKPYVAAANEGPIYPEEKKLLEEALAKVAAIPPLPAPGPAEPEAAPAPPPVVPPPVPMPTATPTPTPVPTTAPTPIDPHPLAMPSPPPP